MNNRTGLFSNIVIWFGVAISVSEIEAGIQLGSMSPMSSIWIPLILGHIIGGILLFFIGFIGARTGLNAMQTTVSAFGDKGSMFFALLNVMQLIAWVAVLYAQGAMALAGLNLPLSFTVTCIILALIVTIWVYIGIKRSSKITSIVMIILTLLLIVLSVKLIDMNALASHTNMLKSNASLGFWSIFEISIAMPVSWLPVISDYTRDVENPVMATFVSALSYTVASLWMYFIGIEIAGIGAGSTADGILLAGMGSIGVIILVLSTITTNLLATNSAGESSRTVFSRIDSKLACIIVSILSALTAISGIMDHFLDFLYLITSVFGPMASVLMVSYYLGEDNKDNWIWNLFAWLLGFIVYQVTVRMDSVILGPTLLAVIVSALLAYMPILFRRITS